MKKVFLLVVSTLVLIQCKTHEKPTYEGIENLKVIAINKKEVIIGAVVKFHNPNHLGGNVTKTDIDVLFEEIAVAKLVSSKTFKIPNTDYFTVPMEATIPIETLLDNNSLLGSITGILLNKKIDLTFKGTMVFDFKIMDYKYQILEEKSLMLKKSKSAY